MQGNSVIKKLVVGEGTVIKSWERYIEPKKAVHPFKAWLIDMSHYAIMLCILLLALSTVYAVISYVDPAKGSEIAAQLSHYSRMVLSVIR
jgi:hypothetical protein